MLNTYKVLLLKHYAIMLLNEIKNVVLLFWIGMNEVITIPLEQLYEPYYNPRSHPQEQLYNLSESLREFGQRRTISVWPDGKGKYEVLAGNGIKKAAELAKLPTLNCTLAPAEWPEIRRKAYAQADNQSGAVDDMVKVAQILEEVRASGEIELAALGSSSEKVDQLLEDLAQAAEGAWEETLGALPDGDKAPFQQMTFTLSDSQASRVKNAIAAAHKVAGDYKDSGNENSNGNALAFIAEWFVKECSGEGGLDE